MKFTIDMENEKKREISSYSSYLWTKYTYKHETHVETRVLKKFILMMMI